MTPSGEPLEAIALDLDGRVDELAEQAGRLKLLAHAILADESADPAERIRQLGRLHAELDTLDVRMADVVLASLRFRSTASRGDHAAR